MKISTGSPGSHPSDYQVHESVLRNYYLTAFNGTDFYYFSNALRSHGIVINMDDYGIINALLSNSPHDAFLSAELPNGISMADISLLGSSLKDDGQVEASLPNIAKSTRFRDAAINFVGTHPQLKVPVSYYKRMLALSEVPEKFPKALKDLRLLTGMDDLIRSVIMCEVHGLVCGSVDSATASPVVNARLTTSVQTLIVRLRIASLRTKHPIVILIVQVLLSILSAYAKDIARWALTKGAPNEGVVYFYQAAGLMTDNSFQLKGSRFTI